MFPWALFWAAFWDFEAGLWNLYGKFISLFMWENLLQSSRHKVSMVSITTPQPNPLFLTYICWSEVNLDLGYLEISLMIYLWKFARMYPAVNWCCHSVTESHLLTVALVTDERINELHSPIPPPPQISNFKLSGPHSAHPADATAAGSNKREYV